MALDTRLPLIDVSPDTLGSITQGANLGLGLSRAYSQAQDAQAQRKRMGVDDAQNNAISVFSILGDTEITPENYGQVVGMLQEGGIPLEEDDLQFSEQNVMQIGNMREAGRGLYQAQSRAAANANRVVNTAELGGGAMQITYANGRTEVVTPTDEQRAAIQLAQEQQISYEEALNKARGRGRTGGALEAEIEKSPEMIAIERELEEMKAEVAQNQKAKIAEIETQAKIDSEKVAAAQTYNDLLPSLNRFDEYAQEGIYGGSWGDVAAQAFSKAGIVLDQEKLDRTARAKMIATQLKFMAKPKGMGAMSDAEWGIIQQAIPDPESATMSQIRAGIDEFKKQLEDKMAQPQGVTEVDIDNMTEEQLDAYLAQ